MRKKGSIGCQIFGAAEGILQNRHGFLVMLEGINAVLVGVKAKRSDRFDGVLQLDMLVCATRRDQTYRWKET